MYSCIYEGQVRHRRFSPAIHEFNYKLYLAYIDLDELDSVFDKRWFWSSKRAALARLKREDYIGDSTLSIKNAVNKRVLEETGNEIEGRVRMLTHLRYFGYVFNPVTFYYCFDKTDNYVKTVVAEITNTPWKERHSYVLNVNDSNEKLQFYIDKEFHVSPFMQMDLQYDWRFTIPSKTLNVHMINFHNEEKIFDATLRLNQKKMSSYQCARILILFPLMTVKVIIGIYWQALKLFLKKIPIYDHKKNIENKIDRGVL
ncbi:DUF1365 domain-containing protein [Nitrosomonadaceae bacterium]|nr:DUF1365 domain-containing protein [Nitrosomonadaceae bacterium]